MWNIGTFTNPWKGEDGEWYISGVLGEFSLDQSFAMNWTLGQPAEFYGCLTSHLDIAISMGKRVDFPWLSGNPAKDFCFMDRWYVQHDYQQVHHLLGGRIQHFSTSASFSTFFNIFQPSWIVELPVVKFPLASRPTDCVHPPPVMIPCPTSGSCFVVKLGWREPHRRKNQELDAMKIIEFLWYPHGGCHGYGGYPKIARWFVSWKIPI